jgi:hypothetical protein
MYNNINQESLNQVNSKVKRFDIINHLIKKLRIENPRYLEIGVLNGENIRNINATYKDGVDPGIEGYMVPEVNYPMTSDAFFDLIKDRDVKYDIIFIDGLHHSYQVTKDIENSLRHLNTNGYIILHDCNPVSFESQKVPREVIVWNGDVWKSIVNLRLQRSDLVIRVVDTDFGIGIISPGKMERYEMDTDDISWEFFQQNKKEILNLISVEEFEFLY